MNELEEAGWSKTPDKPKEELTNKVFKFLTPDFSFASFELFSRTSRRFSIWWTKTTVERFQDL